jgi:hypothetical protein
MSSEAIEWGFTTFTYKLGDVRCIQRCLELNDNRVVATFKACRHRWPEGDVEAILDLIESVQDGRTSEASFSQGYSIKKAV